MSPARWMALLCGCVVACSRPIATRQTMVLEPQSTGTITAPVDASASVDASDASAPQAQTTATLPIFAAPLGENDGVIFAPTAGGTVELAIEGPGRSSVMLRDGERVRVIEEQGGVGLDDAVVLVAARGLQGSVRSTSVIAEGRLSRARDGRWVFLHAMNSCGDFCHYDLWLLGASGARLNLCGADSPCGPVEPRPAWSADQRTFAVSKEGSLVVVDLSTGAMREVEQASAPMFSTTSRLFARRISESDDVIEVQPDGAARTVLRVAGYRGPSDSDPGPAPVVFEGDGSTLCAEFVRRGRSQYGRATLEGAPVRRSGPCAR